MIAPVAPQPDSKGSGSVDLTPVPPASISSPLTPFIAEKQSSKLLSLLLGAALGVAVGGVAFAAGRLTAPASAAPATGTARGGNGTGFGGANGFVPGASGAPGGAGAGGLGAGGLGAGGQLTIQGTVLAISDTSISITLASGATIQVPIDSSTTFHGQTAATAADVKTGQTVEIAMNGGFGGFGRGGGQGQSAANPSAPTPVGAPGGAPVASPGGGASGFAGGRGIAGPARAITILTR